MVDQNHIDNLATTEVIIQVVAGLADAVQNPDATGAYRNALLEHKVAAALSKKMAKHLVRKE